MDRDTTVQEMLAKLPVGTLVMNLDRAGFPNSFLNGVVPLTPQRRFVGRARTLRCLPTRPDIVAVQKGAGKPTPHRLAMDGISPGQVLVIEARGERGAAVMGDLLAARIKAAGGVAAVTDGCVRDVPALAASGLPVYAAGVNATLFANRHVAMAIDEPIACAGVLVMPGDFLVGDAEGVVVIPAHMAESIAAAALEMEALDAFLLEKIRAGEALARVYPPNAEVLAEYESYRKRKAAS
jgi:5-oxopent-3-ene-1,2,5-tricarboxylate decarboxylase / 2-hydroxyhepta-2,4-diene-1,7-dioate isomerase